MDLDDDDNSGFVTAHGEDDSRSAVNSLILDYYKKFGRKRDLEQYFSLSTAQTDLRDPTSTFWRKMKSENDSSDSGEKKSESSQEVCRISIRCALPEPCTSQEEDSKTKSESVSPPIITEEVSHDSGQNSDVESQKSEDNHSQKSYDILLDTSMNKPLSPSSSITSQRKLEWDSLADVGYGNESDRKTSASSLSTLERLALIQQYSNNDNQSSNIGPPTAHSTPLDENEPKCKTKKGLGKKSTRIYKRDTDLVEVNVPQSSDNPTQSINVNLTKHISFNVEKDGKITVENVQKNVSVSPENVTKEDNQSKAVTDKEIQTSLHRTKDVSIVPERHISTAKEEPDPTENPAIKIPVMISLNTLRKKTRRKRMRMAKRKLKAKKKKQIVQEKSIEQLSEAESFEYMPGHIYNQNQLQAKEERPSNAAGNKSSLESSGVLTADSSKGSAHSFTKDLEKSIELLRNALRDRCDDSNLRKQLIKQICERLIKSKYRDDDSTSDFLSGFSFRSKKAKEKYLTTTSTSDANDSGDKLNTPKKSILRNDKFNAGAIASTSQSAPNLPVATDSEKPVSSKLAKTLLTSNTDTELSNPSSDNAFAKTSSEELYQKYLAALRREEAYKRHLKDKQMFLKQKLVNSDGAFNVTPRDAKVNSRLQDLIKDLTRNNYDDGSGDASKLEGGPNSNTDFDRFLPIRSQRSHSVFTLSSGNSDYQNKKSNLKKRLQYNLKDMTKASTSKDHYCCCPHHSNSFGVTDSSVQVNIKVPSEGDSLNEIARSRNDSPLRSNNNSPCIRRNSPRRSPRKDTSPRNTKFACVCHTKTSKDIDDLLVYKCAKPLNKGDSCSDKCSLQSNTSCSSKNQNHATTSKDCSYSKLKETKHDCQSMKKSSKSSQTNLLIKMLRRRSSDRSATCSCDDRNHTGDKCSDTEVRSSLTYTKIYEATRCIQTEISINPRISDPTLSDVNIVNDSSCAQLICEGCREAPKRSITDIYSCDLFNQATFSGSSKSTKSSGTSKNVEEIKDELCEESEKNYRANENTQLCVPIQCNVEKIDDFAIPIQGTNMTLLVSINSNERKNRAMPATENAIVGTEMIEKNEQATSLTEECSKGVQYEDIGALNLNSNIQNRKNPQPSNTYPRSPINDRKPFLRTNTDPANLGQIDMKGKHNLQTSKKCSCGCDQKDCNNKCLEKMDTTSCKTPRDDQQCSCSCGQKDCKNKCFQSGENTTNKCMRTLDETRKCSCGCEQKDCNNKCFNECKPLLRTNTDTANLERALGRTDIIKDKRSNPSLNKCSCGCDEKDCNNKCLNKKDTTSCKTTKDDKQCACSCGQKDCNNKCLQTGENTTNKCIKTLDDTRKCSCGCEQKDCNNKCFNECKPLLRTNTDSANQERALGQTDIMKDKNSNPCSVNSQTSNKCFCGCDQNDCNNKCLDKKDTTSCKTLTDDKQCACSCGQKDCNNKCLQTEENTTNKCMTTLDDTRKCSCGCDQKDCNNKCLDKKDTTSCKTPKDDKQCACSCGQKDCNNKCLQTGENTTNKCIKTLNDTRKCSCGCEQKDCNNKCFNECKPLFRTNTDSANLERVLGRTDIIKDKRSNPLLKECGCGCDEKNCNNKCLDKKDTTSCKTPRNDKQDTTSELVTILDETRKCSCGCEQKDCNNKCLQSNLNLSLKNLDNAKNKSVKQKKDYKDNSKCLCGCGNAKNNCKFECSELNVEGTSCRKEIGIQTNYLTQLPSGDQVIYNMPKVTKFTEPNKNLSDSEVNIKKPYGTTDVNILRFGIDTDQNASDPILDMIQNITKRYSKKNLQKTKRKNCFKEIMNVLKYLVETEESTDHNECSNPESTTPPIFETFNLESQDTFPCITKEFEKTTPCGQPKKLVDKGIQLSCKKSKRHCTESSDICSTDFPGTSSDSATCKVLNKIKKECEKYHQKRCKCHEKKCDESSSTSVNCDQCRRVHHCNCRTHKCKSKKCNHQSQKKPVAYNLIIQTSDSIVSEDAPCQSRQLKNIVVKVPPKAKVRENITFKELEAKIESRMCETNRREPKCCRSRSLPNENEISSLEEIIRKTPACTMREYLERNRPDFIENCSQRRNCLKIVNGTRANERAIKRDLLSLRLSQLSDVKDVDSEELQELARELGRHLRQKRPQPKLISEREMKKHSEKIYKSLPEVVQKKEEAKKENEKKTNLLMASIFKKNLQKKTLRGSVNISNYSSVVKI